MTFPHLKFLFSNERLEFCKIFQEKIQKIFKQIYF